MVFQHDRSAGEVEQPATDEPPRPSQGPHAASSKGKPMSSMGVLAYDP